MPVKRAVAAKVDLLCVIARSRAVTIIWSLQLEYLVAAKHEQSGTGLKPFPWLGYTRVEQLGEARS
jgi:hypothetical protein